MQLHYCWHVSIIRHCHLRRPLAKLWSGSSLNAAGNKKQRENEYLLYVFSLIFFISVLIINTSPRDIESDHGCSNNKPLTCAKWNKHLKNEQIITKWLQKYCNDGLFPYDLLDVGVQGLQCIFSNSSFCSDASRGKCYRWF